MERKTVIPAEVCHFTKGSKALNCILPEKRLRLGQIKFTNDPRESRVRSGYGAYKEDQVLDDDIFGQCFAESMRIHDEEWKVMCFTASRATAGNVEALKFRKEFIETIHTWDERDLPGYNHPRMWDHYAEGHAGVCLVFDGIKLDELVHKELGKRCEIFSGKVRYANLKSSSGTLGGLEYSDVMKLGPTEAARKHFFKYYEQYFLTKNLDWEREDEFRWLVHSTYNEPEYVSFVGALKGVLIGMDFPRSDYDTVKTLCGELDVPVGKMGWASGIPSIMDFAN